MSDPGGGARKRAALVADRNIDPDAIASLLPSFYACRLVEEGVLIVGRDRPGFTMESVIDRLADRVIMATEVMVRNDPE